MNSRKWGGYNPERILLDVHIDWQEYFDFASDEVVSSSALDKL